MQVKPIIPIFLLLIARCRFFFRFQFPEINSGFGLFLQTLDVVPFFSNTNNNNTRVVATVWKSVVKVEIKNDITAN